MIKLKLILFNFTIPWIIIISASFIANLKQFLTFIVILHSRIFCWKTTIVLLDNLNIYCLWDCCRRTAFVWQISNAITHQIHLFFLFTTKKELFILCLNIWYPLLSYWTIRNPKVVDRVDRILRFYYYSCD